MTAPDEKPHRVSVPVARLDRWVANFHARHGGPTGEAWSALEPGARGEAADGSWFEVNSFFGAALVEGKLDLGVPDDWGLLIVRKGGFAVARLRGTAMVSSKVGRRHVQGRSKAGGQSQQRFARRRENQAKMAWQAAADRLVEHCADLQGPLVTAGDQMSLREVLGDRRISGLRGIHWSGDVAEPRRDTVEALVAQVTGWQVTVHNAS